MEKLIAGLDLGTNSIGWAAIVKNDQTGQGRILGMGSRILPIGQDIIGNFNKGITQSEAAERTKFRGVRRLRERELLRKKRLEKVLKAIGWMSKDFYVNHEHSYAYERIDGKNKFKFSSSYNEMVSWLKSKNEAIDVIPFDWTLYFLRVKALTERISKEELVWVLMSFNQKRGYYQLRGDETDQSNDDKYFVSDMVESIEDTGEIERGKKVLMVTLQDGVVGKYINTYIPEWVGKNIDFLVTEKNLKSGEKIVTLSNPGDTDWTFRKKRIESDLENQDITVAQKIMLAFARDPQVKIRGKEIHTIDRKFYRDELKSILEKQKEFYLDLTSLEVSSKVAMQLYMRNEKQKQFLSSQSLIDIIINDVIYYQRPLRSQKSLITNCEREFRFYKDNDGSIKKKSIKAAPKSHPIFQEYRIWSLIHNIKVTQLEVKDHNGKISFNVDKTSELLTFDSKAKLFILFDSNEKVSVKQILKLLGVTDETHKINYDGESLKGNETKAPILKAIGHDHAIFRVCLE